MKKTNSIWQISSIILVLLAFIVSANQLSAQEKQKKFDGWYHLKTQFRGDGECLEGNQAGSRTQGGVAFMDKCKNVTGQLWKIEDAGNGYYRLKTKFRGDGECLEGNQASSSTHGGRAFMTKCQKVTGQLWKIEDAGNGYYRLKTKFRGDGECLEGNQAANSTAEKPTGGGANMAKCQNVSGQLWKIVKAKDVSTVAQESHRLKAGKSLKAGNRLMSKNGKFILRMQEDGHICVYKFANGKQGAFVWGSGKHGFKNAVLKMQEDGNLVVYDGKGESKWSSETHPFFNAKFKDPKNKPVKLVLKGDGSLVLVNAAGDTVWTNK